MVNKTQPTGKPTVQQDTHDANVGQREKEGAKQEGAKPTVDKANENANQKANQKANENADDEDEDDRGRNYGQREGSTISEDNDVE